MKTELHIVGRDLHRVTPIVRDRYIPACGADACDQGRKAGPCPYECGVPMEEGESTFGLVVSPFFWPTLIVFLALWSAFIWVITR